jgi:glycosyltransferase involved in cell wall biosynthesis
LAGARAIITSQLSYRSLAPLELRLGLRLTDRLADRVVVNCKAMWRHMAADQGCPEKKLFLCYNGVETDLFHPGTRDLPQKVGEAPLVIGCVCALRPEKRLDSLVRAFARVRGVVPGAKLAIVGSGTELCSLQSLGENLGVADDIVFEAATADVAQWLRAMDIFVLASDSEAFSNALLEAMACGCCPVGSRVGGTPELIVDGENGLLFDPHDEAALADCLEKLMQAPALRRRFAAASGARARERFSMDRTVDRISALYQELLELR